VKIGWKERFKKEILEALRMGPRTTPQIYRILKRKWPKYCDDTEKCTHYKFTGTRQPEWKHKVRWIQHTMQREFLIYLDKGTNEWKIVEW